ncbi:Com family DNA-binding transcriptional regulator [Amorphus coralli]|uniref:Com family DNA-binding transcriptional regulator n=1 Tax=Amorphus coralli TaxID=340680 RepID=UPI00146F65C7
MKDVRCGRCTALLYRVDGEPGATVEIKCRRCRTVTRIEPANRTGDLTRPELPSGTDRGQ